MEWLLNISAWALPVLLAVTLHEAAHGFVAEKFGDSTARDAGRVTLNPFKHVDPFGTVLLPALLLFAKAPVLLGYAKPVPVDFSRVKPWRTGMLLVALAGPGVNVLLAVISALLLHLEAWLSPESWLFTMLHRSLLINAMLAALNMLPVLPLDGGRSVRALLPGAAGEAYARTERFGFPLLILLLLLPFLTGYNVLNTLVGEPAFRLLQLILALTGNGEVATLL